MSKTDKTSKASKTSSMGDSDQFVLETTQLARRMLAQRNRASDLAGCEVLANLLKAVTNAQPR